MTFPYIEKYEIIPGRFVEVVRCDVVPGGFKRLAVDGVYKKMKANNLVFATNSLGTGALALTLSLEGSGKNIVIFLSNLDSISPNLSLCEKLGARLDFSGKADIFDSEGLRKEALEKYKDDNCEVLPLGLENEEVKENIVKIAKDIFSSKVPKELWVATASGLTVRALQEALPETNFHAVLVKGNNPDVGKAKVHISKEKFIEQAKIIPPYPSNLNYDAKVWSILLEFISRENFNHNPTIFNIA